MASNNDCGLRDYDMERFQLLNHLRFDWPVNVSPIISFHYVYIYENHPGFLGTKQSEVHLLLTFASNFVCSIAHIIIVKKKLDSFSVSSVYLDSNKQISKAN